MRSFLRTIARLWRCTLLPADYSSPTNILTMAASAVMWTSFIQGWKSWEGTSSCCFPRNPQNRERLPNGSSGKCVPFRSGLAPASLVTGPVLASWANCSSSGGRWRFVQAGWMVPWALRSCPKKKSWETLLASGTCSAFTQPGNVCILLTVWHKMSSSEASKLKPIRFPALILQDLQVS